MDEGEDLAALRDEILTAIKSQAFGVFRGTEVGDAGIEFQWQDKDDWKGFLDLAKREEVRVMVFDEKTFSEKALETLLAPLPEDDMKSILGEDNLQRLRSAGGKVGAINLHWVKGDVVYSLEISTKWYDALSELVEEHFASTKEGETREESRMPIAGLARLPLPKAVKSQSPEELAQQMIEFGKKELGALDLRSFYQASRLFWQRLGVSDFGDSETELLREKVRKIAEQRVTDEVQKQERDLLPKLVSECLEWADKYEIPKLTKQNLKAFLAEKNMVLTKNSEDILLVQANSRLKTR